MMKTFRCELLHQKEEMAHDQANTKHPEQYIVDFQKEITSLYMWELLYSYLIRHR